MRSHRCAAAAAVPVVGRAGCMATAPTTRAKDGASSAAASIQAKIAWPKSGHGSGLGKQRWVVERTIAWLHQYRRLRVRYERRDDIHEAFLTIGCSLICLKLLHPENAF